jgi:hypothetical protein
MRTLPEISFAHLYHLSDGIGLFEHAKLTEPRVAHGYCVDDVARGLIVAVRQPEPSQQLTLLAALYLQFVVAAQVEDGRIHNRRGAGGEWQDEPTLEDCWGRALWGLGTAVSRAPALAAQALTQFEVSMTGRPSWPRAMAFAGLGAAEVLRVRPDHAGARALLGDAAAQLGSVEVDANWPWPEPRLRYANAALPEILLAAGSLLRDGNALARGLDQLQWLLDLETSAGWLSVTPAGGWSPGEPRPGFDQQPIEVAALADACARAFDLTGEDRWRKAVTACAEWFLGNNDAQIALLDPLSGGGCDGLEVSGRNENQGAESTLAMIATFQQARRLNSITR